MPEAAQAKDAAQAAAHARDVAVARRTEAGDLEREVKKFEGEVEKVRARAVKDAELLDSGAVANAKQLTDLQHEIASLKRRQQELEDAELEFMERLEEAREAAESAARDRDRLAEEAEAAKARLTAAMADLADQYRATVAQRAEIVGTIPPDLLALYEKVRADHDGLAAVPFAQNQCGACQLQMVPADLKAVKSAPVDEVVRCEECRRILVRTELLSG